MLFACSQTWVASAAMLAVMLSTFSRSTHPCTRSPSETPRASTRGDQKRCSTSLAPHVWEHLLLLCIALYNGSRVIFALAFVAHVPVRRVEIPKTKAQCLCTHGFCRSRDGQRLVVNSQRLFLTRDGLGYCILFMKYYPCRERVGEEHVRP